MSEKKQPRKIRFSDSELSVIKNTFADNHEEMTRVLRKVFLQMPLDVLDSQYLENLRKSKEVMHVLRKTFLPTIDVDSPIFQVIDLWMTIDVKDKTLEQAEINIGARELLIEYLEQQLRFIEVKDEYAKVSFSELTKFKGTTVAAKKVNLIKLVMRNTLLNHIEQQIQQLQLLAGQKDETPQQTLERLAKNSTK